MLSHVSNARHGAPKFIDSIPVAVTLLQIVPRGTIWTGPFAGSGQAVQAIASRGNAAWIVPRREIVPRGTIVKTDTDVWRDLRRISVARCTVFSPLGVVEVVHRHRGWGIEGGTGVGGYHLRATPRNEDQSSSRVSVMPPWTLCQPLGAEWVRISLQRYCVANGPNSLQSELADR